MTKETGQKAAAGQGQAGAGKEKIDVAAPDSRAVVPVEELTPEPGEPPEADGILNRSKDRRRLMTALSRVQGEVLNAKKSQQNIHFKTSYADLAEIADACRAALSRHLIAWVQIPVIAETGSYLETTLTHGPSGQWVSGRLPIPEAAMKSSQDLVAAITYRRRVGLASMVGVVSEDDDDAETGRMAESRGDRPEEQPRGDSKAVREAKEWADWAARKAASFKTLEELLAFQEKYQKELASLEKMAPDHHKKLKDAIEAAGQKLDG